MHAAVQAANRARDTARTAADTLKAKDLAAATALLKDPEITVVEVAKYPTGANEVAGRHTRGHFDFPMRGCTVTQDDTVVIDAGKVSE